MVNLGVQQSNFRGKGMNCEAKLCILCIASGFCNRPQSYLSRNLQHLLFFFDLSWCFEFRKQIPKTLYRSKSLQNRRICGIRNSISLHLRIPHTFCGIHLQLRNPEQLDIFACCRVRDSTNVSTKFTLQVFVRGIHGNFVSGFHLHFGICVKVCLWNLRRYKHKIVRLSSAQFSLVMMTYLWLTFWCFCVKLFLFFNVIFMIF